MKKLENKLLPTDFDYRELKGLRLEAQEKLNKIKPLNIGQASRISGVSPADISVLLIWLAANRGQTMQMRDYLFGNRRNNLQLTEEQLDKFDLLFKLLKEWNEKINLTAITDAQGVAVKHFADSLSVASIL